MNFSRDGLILVMVAVVVLGIQTNYLIWSLQGEFENQQKMLDRINKVVTPEVKELKFEPTASEVKQGDKITVNVTEGLAKTAKAADGSKLKATLNPAGNKIEIAAEESAALGDVEITVEGIKLPTAKFKVKVIAKPK